MNSKEVKATSKSNPDRLFYPDTLHLPVFDAEYIAELEDGNSIGFCILCGMVQDGCEPDACYYDCENCNRNGVFGLEELLLMGYVIEGGKING
jgi:hypothetical protein